MVIAGHNIFYKPSIDSHLVIYVSQSSILEAPPNIYYCGWRWLLLDTIAYPIFAYFENCLYDENETLLSCRTQQVSGQICIRYNHVLYVCGNVNRRHHHVWRPYIRSDTHLKKTLLYLDVARNSRTRMYYGNCRQLVCVRWWFWKLIRLNTLTLSYINSTMNKTWITIEPHL